MPAFAGMTMLSDMESPSRLSFPISEHAFVAQLTLTNFRNYAAMRLELDGRPVVLVGPNGAGKTNILEAISLLTPGRGLRQAKLSELDHLNANGMPQPWAVASLLSARDGSVQLGTGRDPNAPTQEKRVALVDGRRVRGMAELAEHLSALWLTPQQDQVLFEGGGARRRFLDRLVYGFEPEHAARIATYETAMSERNRLLKKEQQGRGAADPHWLDALEQRLAAQATAIAAARLETLERIAQAMRETDPAFPQAQCVLKGFAEDAMQYGESALDIEDRLREALRQSRARDGMIGRTGVGTHRSEWQVFHPKGTEAAQCSTGEQKALLLSLLLAQARASQRWLHRVPLLLLDEVVAHLDETRRRALFDQIRHLRVQAWLTGTDASFFEGLQPDAQGFRVENAAIEKLDF